MEKDEPEKFLFLRLGYVNYGQVVLFLFNGW